MICNGAKNIDGSMSGKLANFSTLKNAALTSRKRAIAQDFKVCGEYYSPSADRYLMRLQEYGIYCKEEKRGDWLKVTKGLVNNIGATLDYDWFYEAFLFENTCIIMEAIHGDINWFDFKDISSKCTARLVEDMTELLLEFSPNGVAFVDNVVKKYVPQYDEMVRVQEMYESLKKEDRLNRQLVKLPNEVK